MAPLARSLLALAAAALLHGACAAQRKMPGSQDTSVSLGKIQGNDVTFLPQIHLGVSDVIVTIPNDCDPYGYLRRDLLGSVVIVSDSAGGPAPFVTAVDPGDPQSDLEVHCNLAQDSDETQNRCPAGLDVQVYQFCKLRRE